MAAARATVAHCDMLIAVWDGRPPRGRGGTAEVVDLAVAAGHASHPHSGRRGGADDPAVERVRPQCRDPQRRRPRRPPAVRGRIAGAAAERGADPAARSPTSAFSTTGSSPKRRGGSAGGSNIRCCWRSPGSAGSAAAIGANPNAPRRSTPNGSAYSPDCSDWHGITASLDLLEQAYGWSDRLAGYYAQNFRSGHIFNFILAAERGAARPVVLRAAGVQDCSWRSVEFVVALAVIFNTRFGVSHEWHRRWLDYRQLAERLRPLRSLKLLGVAAPDPPGSIDQPGRRGAGSTGMPPGCGGRWAARNGAIDTDKAAELAEAIACHEIEPQIAYHEAQRQADRHARPAAGMDRHCAVRADAGGVGDRHRRHCQIDPRLGRAT